MPLETLWHSPLLRRPHHGFCLDLLRAEVPEFLKYDVLSEVQQVLFVDRHGAQSGLTGALMNPLILVGLEKA